MKKLGSLAVKLGSLAEMKPTKKLKLCRVVRHRTLLSENDCPYAPE